jgi:hypothetical protein
VEGDAGGFVVQSVDWLSLPAHLGQVPFHEWSFWHLFCGMAPEERGTPAPTLEEAIAAFEARFGTT